MVDLMMRGDSMRVEAHMCRFGMTSRDQEGEGLVKKPTYFATNCPGVADELDKKCFNTTKEEAHRHVQLLSGRARAAQVYPQQLCRAICRGFLNQTKKDQKFLKMIGSLEVADNSRTLKVRQKQLQEIMRDIEKEGAEEEEEQVRKGRLEVEKTLKSSEDEETWYEAWDDVKDRELDPKLVMKARSEEVRYIHKSNLYKKAPRSRCYEVTGKAPIKSGWVDTNKGDSENPNYRSRWVGKEYNTGKDTDMFAATPPLEALRVLVSWLATSQVGQQHRKRMLICDVSRAFFYAPVEKALFVELPDEDKEEGKDEVAELQYSLYGTRDAAANWHKAYSQHLKDIGFEQGDSNPCLFYHPGRQIRLLVHGDDYVGVADDYQLKWLQKKIEDKFEIKSQTLGPDSSKGEKKQVSILGRIIEWKEEGISYEADPRHAQKLIRELELENCKEVTTPGIKIEESKKEEGDEEELEGAERTKFRAVVARGNYLALDRPDISFATKEASRRMSKPMKGDWKLLKRIGRYLKGRPRAVTTYRWQEERSNVDTMTDSDWAGCRRTRRSTTGGAIMVGEHVIKYYSKTQANIALSSGEAELYAIVKASCETLGTASMYLDWGLKMRGRVWADASAALGIIGRKGLGKVRHLDTSILWVQEAALRKQLLYAKVKGEENIADLFTKYLDRETLDRHVRGLGIEYYQYQSCIALGIDNLHDRPQAQSGGGRGGVSGIAVC